LHAQERRVAEGAEALEEHVERAPRLRAQPAAEDDDRAADPSIADLEHVLRGPAQQVLGDDEVVERRLARDAAAGEGPQAHDSAYHRQGARPWLTVQSPSSEPRDGGADGGDAGFQVDGAEQRLQRGGQDRLTRPATGLVLAAAETEQRPET